MSALLALLLSAPACAPATQRAEGGRCPAPVREERVPLRCAHAIPVARTLVKLVEETAAPHCANLRSARVDEGTAELVVVVTREGLGEVRRNLSEACVVAPADGRGVDVVPLLHAVASEVARAVGRSAPAGARVSADEPTNSVVLEGTPEERRELRRAVTALDHP